ncbi:5-AMP-activated protein kinase, beta subunit, interaction domain-containing protein [Artemisia annua]|uniref:5-AMP-activated protein kinase, beta subunit, interaction domain-containing protein n=1 Tax=Artemisia annua TaxID=35608 RepID=A0A2U1NTB8_ARTAN|nr:5-AMP-activated protein kinase, beta subunit, interaction domain-containing protein [Artemisia annua]
MNNNHSQDQETPVVAGFEVPRSPDASYNNVYTASEDDGRDPPVVPQHLQHTVLSYPTNGGLATPLPDPQHVVLNHLYIENREAPSYLYFCGFKVADFLPNCFSHIMIQCNICHLNFDLPPSILVTGIELLQEMMVAAQSALVVSSAPVVCYSSPVLEG